MSDEPQEHNYTFKQTKNAITVELPSPEDLVQEDIDVSIVGKKLSIVVRKPGEDEEKLLEDTLHEAVNPNSLDWKLDTNKWRISLTVKKVEAIEWPSLFVVVINIPPIFQFADENKVNEVIKIFKEAKRKEDGGDDGDDSGGSTSSSHELISMKHPIKGYSIVSWATMNRKYPVIEFLLRAFGPKKVANLVNEQDFEIIKEWQKEKRRLHLLEKKQNEPKESTEEEEEPEEEKDFASGLVEKFEKYTVELIKQIGEYGIYEGETAEFEIPVEIPPVVEEEPPKEEPKEEPPTTDENSEEKNEDDNENNDDDEPKEPVEKKPKKVKVVEPPKPIIVKYRHGFGSAYYPNDDVYIGTFDNTIREGMGAYIYRGDYLKQLREKKEKEQEEKDEEDEGNAEGDEEAFNPENVPLCYYVGDWKKNMKNGKGRMLYHNGDRFYGDYVDDKKQCERGIYLYSNGDMYVGEFKEDHKTGKGVYTFAADGSSLDGEWKEGKFISGVWNWKDGKIAFSSENFAGSNIDGNFSFANFKSFGSFIDGQWKMKNITL